MSTRSSELLNRLTPWGTLLALGLLILVFGVAKPNEFLSWGNFQIILSTLAGLAIVSGGLTVVLILGEFDLSFAAMATLSGLVSGLLVADGMPIGAALGLALALGVVVGLINGLVIVKLHVSSFIATLASTAVLGGLATWWAASEAVPISNSFYLSLAADDVLGIPIPAVLAILIYAILWVVLERTLPGRMMYATGANLEGARLTGIPTARVRVLAFAVCSMLAALAGILLASRLSAAYQGAANPYLLEAFAAVFVGAVTLRLGQFHIFGTAVGVLLLTVLTNGLDILAVPSYVSQLVSGAILIMAVSLAGIRSRAGSELSGANSLGSG
jgi:ribose transport system permease protein